MSRHWVGAVLALVALPFGLGQPPGVINPLAQDCGFGGSVVCINKYVRPTREQRCPCCQRLNSYRLP